MSRAAVLLVAAFTASLVGASCASCQTPTPPPVSDAGPPPPPPPIIDAAPPLPPGTPTAVTVYNELVEAGLLAPDPVNGPGSVQADYNSDVREPWLACLFAGGTVQSCAVWDAATASVRRRAR